MLTGAQPWIESFADGDMQSKLQRNEPTALTLVWKQFLSRREHCLELIGHVLCLPHRHALVDWLLEAVLEPHFGLPTLRLPESLRD
jgi:hypothetical protein